MTALLVVATQAGAGKTALCAGLGSLLRQDGAQPAYRRLRWSGDADRQPEADALFIAGLFGLAGAPPRDVPRGGHAGSEEPRTPRPEPRDPRLGPALAAGDGDPLLVEAPGGLFEEGVAAWLSPVAEALDARVLVVGRFCNALRPAKLAPLLAPLRQRVVGLVINAVPSERRGWVGATLAAEFDRAGIPVLGQIPLDRTMLSLTVGELALAIDGNVLCCEERSDDLLLHYLIGGRSWDPATPYLRRQSGFAFITRGDLQDVLLAATAAPTTRCLVLTHGVAPSIAIRYRAEEAEIPIVVTPHDTVETMRRIDAALLRLRFSHPQKLDAWRQVLVEHLSLEALGLAPAQPAAV